MKDIELANGMIDNLEMFEAQPDWEETVKEFRPAIEKMMELEGCNAMKAALPFLKKFQEEGDDIGGRMLMAVVTQMMLDAVVKN